MRIFSRGRQTTTMPTPEMIEGEGYEDILKKRAERSAKIKHYAGAALYTGGLVSTVLAIGSGQDPELFRQIVYVSEEAQGALLLGGFAAGGAGYCLVDSADNDINALQQDAQAGPDPAGQVGIGAENQIPGQPQ